LRLVTHRDIPEAQGLRDPWNALVEQMEHPEVFYTHEWATAVHRAYHDSLEPLLFLGYVGEKLLGVAALATNAGDAETFFLGGATADYCDFVSAPEYRLEFVNDVLGALRKMKMPRLVLANLPAESATYPALVSALPDCGYRLFSRPAYRCAQVTLHSAEDRQAVRHSILRRKSKRRQFAAMEGIAPVKLDHLRSPAQIIPSLPDFARMHVARCLSTGRMSNLISSERRAFLRELAELLSRADWITLSRLAVGDVVVAWNYGFHFAGTWFWYQPTFDVGWQQHSPGFYLLTRIVEQACSDETVKAVDLGLGAEPYKDRLANGFQDTRYLTATASAGEWASEVVRYHAVTAIRKLPRAENWLRATRARGSRLIKRVRTLQMKGSADWFWKRCWRPLTAREEMQFFEWPEDRVAWRKQNSGMTLHLRGLELETLAAAAIRYSRDEETLAYLFRYAGRLRSGEGEGFALSEPDGSLVHCCWAAQFEGFFIPELGCKLNAPAERAVLLFDCWTPASLREHGYFRKTISQVASHLSALGKRPWISCSSTNESIVRAVHDAGFIPKFSLSRKWGLLKTRPSTAPSIVQSRTHASSAA